MASSVALRLSASTRDLILSYVSDESFPRPKFANNMLWLFVKYPRLTPDRDFYDLKLRRYLGTSSIPPTPCLRAEQIYRKFIRSTDTPDYATNLRILLESFQGSVKGSEPFLRFIFEELRRSDERIAPCVVGKLLEALALPNLDNYNFYINYLSQEDLQEESEHNQDLLAITLQRAFVSVQNYERVRKEGYDNHEPFTRAKNSLIILEDLLQKGIRLIDLKNKRISPYWEPIIEFIRKEGWESPKIRKYLDSSK